MAVVILPPDLTTPVSAVNALLRSLNEAPINTLDDTESVDAAVAWSSLQEVLNAVQAEGWHWNREYDFTLTPEEDNTVLLPENYLAVMAAYWTDNPTTPCQFTERGRKLYDLEAHSYTSFTQPVTVDLILKLDWTEVPEYARRYVTVRAMQQFQGQMQSSQVVYQVQQSEVDSARAVLEQREDEANPMNMITGNRQTFARLHGQGRRRQNG